MSAALIILPVVWATDASLEAVAAMEPARPEQRTEQRRVTSLAFYRGHTEGLLRRYIRLSMEAGRAPSLLGRDMFRGKVTHYRVHGFDDVVIFVHDVEQCLAKLDGGQQDLIERIALQEYTHDEVAVYLQLPQRNVTRRYGEALDQLTRFFLERKLLVPLEMCQEAKTEKNVVSH
jgi:hypothetical protein